MRTQQEIVDRYESIKDQDFFGFKAGVLLSRLDYQHAEPYLKPGVTGDEWEPDTTEPVAAIKDYMGFAWEKALGHRGISASRSVEKIEEWIWLSGDDDLMQKFLAAGYAQYGVPQLVAVCEHLGIDVPEGDDVRRMAKGLPCEDDCISGCGQ